jgi:PleD family two-component response regulator
LRACPGRSDGKPRLAAEHRASPRRLHRRAIVDHRAVAPVGDGGIPVVLLTARTDDVAMRGSWEAGIDEYISKPFSPRVLVTRVEEILSRSR